MIYTAILTATENGKKIKFTVSANDLEAINDAIIRIKALYGARLEIVTKKDGSIIFWG